MRRPPRNARTSGRFRNQNLITPDLLETPETRQAIDRLEDLLLARGPDIRERYGCAELVECIAGGVISPTWRQLFEGRRKVKLAGGSHPCPQRLNGRSCRGLGCHPPGADHRHLWTRDGRAVRYTMQPYGLSARQVAELTAWCEERGLLWSVDAFLSWHFPSHTILVEIAKPEEFENFGGAGF